MGEAAKKIVPAELWLVDTGTGKVYGLFDGFRVGRTEGDLILSADAAASSRHCVFHVNGKSLQIEDIGSRNGTFVGGQRIEAKKRLGLLPGTMLGIGNSLFEIHAGKEAPESRSTALEITSNASQILSNSEVPKTASWSAKSQRRNLAFQPGDVIAILPDKPERAAPKPAVAAKAPGTGTVGINRPAGLPFTSSVKLRSPLLAYVFFLVNTAAFGWAVSKGADLFDPSPEALVAVGGNLNSLTTGGQWWRLLSSIFQHSGVAHYLSNMAVLLCVGVPVARITGGARFGLVYITAGLVGAFASIAFNAPAVVSVGASGSLFGVAGALLALQLFRSGKTRVIGKFGLASTAVFVVRNIGIGVQGIDVAAHVGGLLAGFLLGALLFCRNGEREAKRGWIGFALAALVTALLFTVVPHRAAPPPPSQFGQRMAEISVLLGHLETEYKESLAAAKSGKIPQEEFLKLMRERILMGVETAAKRTDAVEAIDVREKTAKAAQLASISLWKDQLTELGALLETKDNAHFRKLEELQRQAAIANAELDKAIAELRKPASR